MDQISAEYLAEDPYGWHVEYWNNLFVVGIFRGEDEILMHLRIEIEISNIPEGNLAIKLRRTWSKFRSVIEEQGKLIRSYLGPYLLEEKSLTDEYTKQLFRDVDRMLADKEQKTTADLLRLKSLMSTAFRVGDTETGIDLGERILDLNQRLCKEALSELYREVQHSHSIRHKPGSLWSSSHTLPNSLTTKKYRSRVSHLF